MSQGGTSPLRDQSVGEGQLICFCGNYTRADIRRLIRSGYGTLERLRKINICNNCTSCQIDVEALLAEEDGRR